MTGRRITEPPTRWPAGECPYGPGDYWKDAAGDWRGVTPNGLSVWLKNHVIVEHEDGTITVTPSILANGGKKNGWHGYLTKGVWNVC